MNAFMILFQINLMLLILTSSGYMMLKDKGFKGAMIIVILELLIIGGAIYRGLV